MEIICTCICNVLKRKLGQTFELISRLLSTQYMQVRRLFCFILTAFFFENLDDGIKCTVINVYGMCTYGE